MKFCGQRYAAKFDERLPARLFRRQTGAQIVIDVQRQMAFQLFGEFPFALLAMEQTEEPHEPAAQLSKVHRDSLLVVGYSVRSATSGSTFVARRAGIQQATSATPASSNATAANVAESVELTS